MGKSSIEWCTHTWNPITGCDPISIGCQNCYAKVTATRLAGRGGYPKEDPFKITFHRDKLREPAKWRKPRRTFVCSMGDLFHKDVPTCDLLSVFGVIEDAAPNQTFYFLTKRPDRMVKVANRFYSPRYWHGITTEDQFHLEDRMEALTGIASSNVFISAEPLLGPIDITDCAHLIEWVIAGAETGQRQRPSNPEWFMNLRDQCLAYGIPFFFKRFGRNLLDKGQVVVTSQDLHKENYSRILDGRMWEQYPEGMVNE